MLWIAVVCVRFNEVGPVDITWRISDLDWVIVRGNGTKHNLMNFCYVSVAVE